MTLEEAKDLLSGAFAEDCGDYQAAMQFYGMYPAITEAIDQIVRSGDAEQEQTSSHRRGSKTH